MNKVIRYSKQIVALLLIGIVITGCSVKKNNLVSRTYHGILAHYNGYWNAENKYDDGVAQLAKAHEDKYDRILSVYQYGDANKAKSIYPQMDDAIKRVSLVIQRQTMYIRDKSGHAYHEHNKWIPKNWLLVAKCRFMKREYFNALETCQFIGGRYGKDEIRYDAFLLMLKVYEEMAYVSESDNMIDFLKNDPNFPKRLKGEFAAACANYYLMTKDYDKAIQELTKAAIFAKKRDQRARYTFILAQVYQKQGDNVRAGEMYDKVTHMNASYEISFNAEINSAVVSQANSPNSEKIKRKLKKMAKDIKNSDYLDQIYYALAGIELKEGNTKGAVEYLHKSIESSQKNTNQKALSYLELGKIHFDRPEYKPAQMYYDSCITCLAKDHPDYPLILNKRNTLTKLIKNLNIIAYEDSLQLVASMPEAERNKMIDGIIQKEKDDKEAAKKKEREEKDKFSNTTLSNQNNSNKDQNKDVKGDWYFYNPATVSFGYTEFLKKWGTRKNEDDWRRSGKSTSAAGGNDDLETVDAGDKDTTSGKDTAKTATAMRAKYLKNIPVGDKAIEASNGRIIEAYYTIGLIYKEQFNDYGEAIKTFETLTKRFPENKFLVPTYYNCYRINLTIKNQERAEYYKNLILSKYPDSEFARLIKNPNAQEETQNSEKKLNAYYEDTYDAYLKGQYRSVIERKTSSDSLFPGNVLKPKFDYLRTLSIGKTKDLNVFETTLKNIIQDYPKDSVSVQAKLILDYIAKIKGTGTNGGSDTTKNNNPVPYIFNPDSAHYYVVSYPNRAIDPIQMKSKVQDYLSKYYSTTTFDVSNFMLDVNSQIIVVKEFGDNDKGMDFYNGIFKNEEVFGAYKTIQMSQFMIDAPNYKLFYGDKDLSKYMTFFTANYLKVK